MLWTFLVVLVGLMGLFTLGYKVYDIIRKEHKARVEAKQLAGSDITDRIADKVMEKLEPKLTEKFDEIDRKLQNDKEQLELHTAQLNAYQNRVNKLEDGNKALCHGIFALLSHEVNGNSIDRLKSTQNAMRDYLIDGVYKEDSWK